MKVRWICAVCFLLAFWVPANAFASHTWIYQNATSFVVSPVTVSSGVSSLTLNHISPTTDISSIILSPPQDILSLRLLSVDDTSAQLKIDFAKPFTSTQKLMLTYLMHGLSWSPSHTLQLSKNGQSVLTSWATLVNHTQAKIGPTHLSLVEGRVNTNGGIIPRAQMMESADMASKGLPSSDGGYYRVYDVGPNLSIEKGEALRVQLLSPFQTTGTQTLICRNYIYSSRQTRSSKSSISIQVALNDTAKESLPAGPVQVYQEIGDTVMWMGTSSLENILPGKKVSFTIGQPVDIEITQSQSNYLAPTATTKARYTYQIQNSRDESVTITFVENFNTPWSIPASSVPYHTSDASSATFSVTIPAQTTSAFWYDVTLQKGK